jgi:PAS domain S-box-containing protein
MSKMKEKDETRKKLIIELAKLRQQIDKLEKSENETKRAADALRESEEKFRSIAECSPNMIFINRKGRVVYANKKCVEIIGYKKKEFYSPDFDFINLIAKESQSLIKKNYSKHQKGEDVLPYEYTLLTKKGDRIEAIITTKLIDYEGEKAILGIITDITERKRMERELEESEENYRQLAGSILDIFYEMDKDLKYTYWNKASEKTTGISAKDAIGKSVYELFPCVKGTEVEKIYKEVVRTKKHKTFVIEYKVGDKTFFLEISAYPSARGLSVFAKDITERKKAEEGLKESEERYRDLVEKADIAIMIDDREGRFKYLNKKFAELFGYSEKAIRKKSIQTLVHPEDARWVMEFHKARLHGGNTPSRYEFKGVKKDGSTIYLEADVVELKEGKSIIGTRSYIWDITERKMAEKQLRESEEKFRSVVVNSSNAIISADAQGNIVFWNPAAENIFGYSSEEAIGKPYSIILPRRFHTVFEKNFKQIVLWKRLGIIENRTEMIGLRKSGEEFPMEVSLSSWITKEGIFFSSSIRDVTEGKKTTNGLKKEYDALKNSVRVNAKRNLSQ